MPIDENCKYITLLDFGFHDLNSMVELECENLFYLHMEKMIKEMVKWELEKEEKKKKLNFSAIFIQNTCESLTFQKWFSF